MLHRIKNFIKNIEFTKVLEIILIIIYYVFYVFCIYYWYNEERYLAEMLTYVASPFSIITAAYLLKSGLANSSNIKSRYDPKKVGKKFTFAKFVMGLITFAFISSVIYFSITWIYLYRFPVDLFAYIAAPFITIVPFFIAKNVMEDRALDKVTIFDIAGTLSDVSSMGINSGTASMISNVVNTIKQFDYKKELSEFINNPTKKINLDELNDTQIEAIFSNYKIPVDPKNPPIVNIDEQENFINDSTVNDDI